MKKVFLFLTMLLFAFTGTMKAESLTVHDGTTTNGNVPVYGFYADAYNKCEMVYPAAELSEMAGGTINSLTFYASQTSVDWEANFQVFVAEVADATISAFAGPGTVVYEGQLSIADGEMVVTFNTPYTYGGGNLLVGVYQTSTGNYITSTWYGEGVNGASGSGYDYSGLDGCMFGQKNFLPKTTFDYTAPSGGGGGELVEVTIGDPTSTTTNGYLPGYTLYDYAISQQIYTADEIGVAGTINTLTVWLKNTSSYARNINVYMKEVEATEFASNTAWESFAAADMVASFTMPNGNDTPIEVALDLNTPFEYSGNSSLAICFQDVTGQWSSGLGGVEMDAAGNQALYAYRDGTVYDPSNVGVSGTLLAKKNVIRLSIMTSGGGASTAFSTIPNVLDLGYRPNGAWMAPYTFAIKSNIGAATINALDFSGNYFTYNAELPATVSGNNPLNVELTTGTAAEGPVASTMTIMYSGNRDVEQFPVTAYAYDPAEGDVVETAIEVPTLAAQTPYTTQFPEGMYKNYELPVETEANDAVYEMTFDHDVLLYAGAEEGNVVLYNHDFNGKPGPMADNQYVYNGPQINPGPTNMWFSYDYTGSNTWYGTSAGGGFYFGYKISTDAIAAYGLAGLTITQVEAAAREAYPYYCYIIEGGVDPFDGNMIGGGSIENPTALYFFDINLNMPAYISGDSDIWVIFYSDSPYAAYCGRYPVDTPNGKIWTCNPNATTPQWTSNTTYTPVIYAHMLELPTGRTATMDLAKMEVKNGNGVASEIAEAEGSVMNAPKAQLAQNNRETQTLLEQGFEDGMGDWTMNNCHSSTGVSTGYTANTGSAVFRFYYTSNYPQYLISPVLEDNNGGNMSFYYASYSSSYAETFKVGYSTTTNDPSAFTWGSQVTATNLYSSEYLQYSCDFPAGTKYVAIACTSDDQFYLFIDDITVTADITSGGGGGGDEPTWTPYEPTFAAEIDGMYVPAGTYYLVAAAADNADVNIAINNVPAPEQAVIIAPTDGEQNVEYPYLAQWIISDYTTEMQVLLGTQYPPQTVLINWTDYLVESAFLPELMPNQNYFMQVNLRNASGTTYGEVIGFSTPIDPVEGFAVAEANLYPGEAAEFSWTASRTFKGYNIYQDGVKINETLITDTEYTVEGLEYNMNGYDFQVTAVYDAGESAMSEAVTVYMTGFGSVNGYVYDTDEEHPIAGVVVAFNGVDEYNADQAFAFTTDENGFYEGELLAGSYTAMVAPDQGYEAMAYAGTVSINYNVLTEGINITTHEFYYPLGMITATEEEADVLVEWSWNPAEMIVDFETGDFSQADFTLPASYAWAITTTNPHDGTYCMKSACEGVASGTSSIEATVDVPYDAKMGFWVKVSTEANYDKFHFYIDGVEMGAALSGQADYVYKEYTVAEGTHTYKWEYAKDSSVNGNDDCVYVDDITMYRKDEPVPPTPGATTYTFDGGMEGWTSLDANNDGYGWVLGSEIGGVYLISGASLAGSGHDASQDLVCSGSYSNATSSAITPDNYLVAPAQISAAANASISFWACAQDSGYPAEHFGVAVSTTTATASAFSMVQEWTMTAKGGAMSEEVAPNAPRGSRAQGNWYQYTVDLGAYAGQDIWVAIRHFNCNDQFILDVDDITLADGSAKVMPRSNRTLASFNLYRRDVQYGEDLATPVLIQEGINPETFSYTDEAWTSLNYGEYEWGIQATYDGYAPVPDRNRETATFGFENGSLEGWTNIIVNTDGGEWLHSNNNPGGYDYTEVAHTGEGFAMCYSYVDYVGAYDTDAYLVSPQKYAVDANSSIAFWADNANDSYPEDFSVCVSTAATPTAASFVEVWNGGAKGTGNGGATVRHSDNRYNNWRSHEVSLAEYAGQEIWIAFHDVNYDAYEIWIDDVTITYAGGVTPPTPPTPVPGGDGLSEILWSNMIAKDMESTLTFNVTLNNGQNPDGAVVTATSGNYEFVETVADSVAELTVRRGLVYNITVSKDGYTSYEEVKNVTDAAYTFDVMLDEIIAPVAGLYVSPTGWAMWDGTAGGGSTPPTPPTPPTGGTSFTEGFEGGLPTGWTVVDGNTDGYTWCLTSAIPSTWTYYASLTLDWYRTGTDAICSGSYINGAGALYPDEYLVTPQVDLVAGSTFSFWAAATDASYPADHFGVFVSDDATNWTSVQEWTLTSKSGAANGGRESRDGEGAKLGTWYNYSVDLSAYAGQKYIAIRHFNCSDQYIMVVDDVELGVVNKGDRAALSYKVMLDGTYIGETTNPFYQLPVEGMEEGSTHTTSVAPLYLNGMGDWMTFEWIYTACNNFASVNALAAAAEGDNVKLTWNMPGVNPGPNPPAGNGFECGFEEGLPTDWTVIDANNDGYTWCLTSAIPTTWTYYASLTLDWYRTGTNAICSGSFINGVGALNPDEYLVMGQHSLGAGSTLSFWAAATDASYPADHFGVFVSDDAANWTMVNEWTLTGKDGAANGGRESRDGNGAKLGTWHEFTSDLSSFAGNKYIAIRHFNCSDQYIMVVDDIALTSGKGGRTVLYEPHFVTDPGAMANGADASWIKNSQSTWGPNCNNGGGYKMADDFTLAAASTINEIEVYGYQTGSTTTSTFTGLYAQIYDGAPNAGGQVVWGDAASNIMTATSFTNCYRGSDGETTATTRPIMAVTATGLNIELEAGTYYLVWSLTGSASSGPWAAPEALPGEGNTGNGLQQGTSGWAALTDSGAGTPYGVAFKLVGEGGGPVPPTPGEFGIKGAMVFVDGEYLAYVDGATASQYVVANAANKDATYAVKVVYDGDNTYPGATYYAMSCAEEVEYTAGQVVCDPVTNLEGFEYDYNGYKAIAATWDAMPNATGYKIYQDGELLGQVAGNSVVIFEEGQDVPAGTYVIGVVAVYATCESDMETVTVVITSVEEKTVVEAIYPNPTSGDLHINAMAMTHVTVFNAMGQMVYSQDVNCDEMVLNMAQYEAGVYMVRIDTENGSSVKRITVVK